MLDKKEKYYFGYNKERVLTIGCAIKSSFGKDGWKPTFTDVFNLRDKYPKIVCEKFTQKVVAK